MSQEVFYTAPRNPEMPTLGIADVVASGIQLGGAFLTVFMWRGSTVPPTGKSRRGTLHVFAGGALFLPFVGPTAKEAALLPLEIAVGGVIGIASAKLDFFIQREAWDEVTDVAQDFFSRLKDDAGLARRLTDPDCITLPYFDVVATSLQQAKKFLSEGWTVTVSLENQEGSADYTFQQETGFRDEIEILPRYFMERRILNESWLYQKDIQRANVDWENIQALLTSQYQAKYGEGWTAHLDEYVKEAEWLIEREFFAKGYTDSQLSEAMLSRFAPMAEYYRQVPIMRWQLESLERTARGEPWQPDWNPPEV